MTEPVWTPPDPAAAQTRMAEFIRFAEERANLPARGDLVERYARVREWSVTEIEDFWRAVWDFGEVRAETAHGGAPVVIGAERMAPPDAVLGPRWFPNARLNFTDNMLRSRGDAEAIVAWNESGPQRSITFGELRADVARTAAALRAHGVVAGDRVAGFLPNIPEAVIAMLASASIGAVWSSCSPDFGVQGVFDRFGQIQPKVLFAADSYLYAGKKIDCRERASEIARRIPEIERIVLIQNGRDSAFHGTASGRTTRWEEFGDSGSTALSLELLPFDHPLYILYSSGTTGLPKCMVHAAGGTLIQHLKEHLLHCDIRPGDRVFYYTTTGWMMWNWLVSVLATGATIVLYDGAPFSPRREILWDMAQSERITCFGTSAKYLALCEKHELAPGRTHDLDQLRTILSTGSPLALHSFDYVYSRVKTDVHLASISGGTDIVSCFAGGNPVAPVYRGELQTRALGMAVDVYGPEGSPLRGEPGELVCTRPFPSMPLKFWNDPDKSKYRAAYFDFFPGVWRHGDWAEITEHEGMIIYGRSDATLNPGGVRIGTAEIYRQVEQLPEVVESVAIGQEIPGEDNTGDVRIVLFVRLREGSTLDEALRERIRMQIRSNTSPLHVPRVIVQVSDIPRTISGKISELAVRDIVHGRTVRNTDALANPEALRLFQNLPELRLQEQTA